MKTLKEKQAELKAILAQAVELANDIKMQAEMNEAAAKERYYGGCKANLPEHVLAANWDEMHTQGRIASDAEHIVGHLEFSLEDNYMFRNLD